MDTEEPSFPLHIEPTFSARNKKHFDDIVGNNQHVKLAAIGTLRMLSDYTRTQAHEMVPTG